MNGEIGGAGGNHQVACVPACGDRECGPDPSCGIPCGVCAAELTCSEGACVSPEPPRENGDTCSADAQCASGLCGESRAGEIHLDPAQRCFGEGLANESCVDVYDCDVGTCIPKTRSDLSENVCVLGIEECWDRQVSSQCEVFILLYCQVIQGCGSVSSNVPPRYRTDFDYCIQSSCVSPPPWTPLECEQAANDIVDGTAGCP
jgi:hypothetical protein